jgi:hypothetical protein
MKRIDVDCTRCEARADAGLTQLPKAWQFDLSGVRDFTIPGFGRVTDRVTLLNIFDRTNLIRPSNGIGAFQAAYGPRITV